MKNIFSYKKFLIIIILVASFLRFWKLGSVPNHLTPDEASLGYNAYSILKTGKDEYGKFLPIIFKSFGDYKPGLYVYTSIIPIAIFGLTEFAIRLPSALAGVIGVFLVYLIIKKFIEVGFFFLDDGSLKQNKIDVRFNYQLFSLVVSFLLAINPWHLHFSRGAWEANLSLTLILAGIYCFLCSLRREGYLIVSSIFFALSLLSYQGAKLSTFVVLLILLLLFFKRILKFKLKILLSSFLIGILISLPLFLSLFGKTGRLQVFSLFSAPRTLEYKQEILDQGNETLNSLSYYLYHSEALNFIRGILGRWFNHFSARFLFFEGDWQNERHSAPNMGQFLVADIVLFALGFFYLIISRGRFKYFVFLWLGLSPLPAILSRDQVHGVRALNMLVPLVFISSLGLTSLFGLYQQKGILQKLILEIFTFVYLGNFVYYLDAYYLHLPIHDAQYWYYGYREAVKEVQPYRVENRKIIFQQSFSQPYIFFLFYEKYDPLLYQKIAHLDPIGNDVGLVNSMDNIEFRSLSWPFGNLEKGAIFVADNIAAPGDLIGKNFKIIREIYYPNNLDVAFRVMEVIDEK